MKLLIITQKVDKNDDVLGFFHGWLKKFADNFESVNVICLEKRACDLPNNLKVLSLGKEIYRSKLKYIFHFYKHIWKLRKDYDAIFVHMNPEYVVLGGLLWKVLNKKIALWYVHKKVSWKLWLAEKFVDKIFTTSQKSINIKSKKIIATGHGINLELFKNLNDVEIKKNTVLSLGRISPVKKLDTLIKAIKILRKKGLDFNLDIIGNPVNKEDFAYQKELKNLGSDFVNFLPAISNKNAPSIYNSYEVFVNLTPIGSFDKTILEAMACERIVLVANKDFESILSNNFVFDSDNAEGLAYKINLAMNLNETEKEEYGREFRQYVRDNHNLKKLIQKIKHAI